MSAFSTDGTMEMGRCTTTFAACAYGFTGKERDTESGNDYFFARYYSSAAGRFLSPDPSGLGFADPANPQSLNQYAYVMNNPLTFVDPSGECGIPAPGQSVVGGVVGAVKCIWQGLEGIFSRGSNTGSGDEIVDNDLLEAGWSSESMGMQFAKGQNVSANGEKAINAAYMVACSHSMDGCSSGQQVNVRYVGFTYNVQIPGDMMKPSTLPADSIKDPGITNKLFHKDAYDSFYLTSPLGMAGANVPHLVDDRRGVEAHIDHFGPANPIHWGEAILSLFINTRDQAGAGFIQTCSPGGGCQ